MDFQALARWVGETLAAKRVGVVTATTAPARRALVVHGPRRLRLEGLDLAKRDRARVSRRRVMCSGRRIAVHALGEPAKMRKLHMLPVPVVALSFRQP